MVTRIDKLTPEQEATFPEWVKRWTAHGLATGPLTVDEWDRTESGARKMYGFAGLEEPAFVIRGKSPLSALLSAITLAEMAKEGDSVGDSVRASVRDSVGANWWKLYDAGNLWAEFPAWLSWFREIGQLELPEGQWEKYEADCDMRTAGPSYWMRGVFAASDRPLFLHRDQTGALHHEDGPAIGWADGWHLNVWHGTSVPNDFFTWNTERALSEKNSEIRRCAIERIGWDSLTDRLTLVSEANDPGNAPHTIRLYDLPPDMADLYDEPARILVVHNASLDKGGHRRTFGLPVPASMKDPISAAASLFDVSPAAYKSLARAS